MRRIVIGCALGACTNVGCGRIGYEPMLADAEQQAAACPDGMAAIADGSNVCIELVERGNEPWTIAGARCAALGRRLCADLEWLAGCENVRGIVDMTDDAYEWVAEESAGVALKRGPDLCTSMSSHVIGDPYEFRCCADL
jgi:hypothetical protein